MLTNCVRLFDFGLLSVSLSDHITTIGAKRPNYGRAGRPIKLEINSFELTVEENNITHYDGMCH